MQASGHFVSEAWVLLQLTNSVTPIVAFRLFAFGIGVSTIKEKENNLQREDRHDQLRIH
jgi:hypothetical protein